MARLGFTPIGHMRVGISPTQTPKTILRNHKTPALLTGPEGGISGVNLVFHRTYGRGMVLTSMPCLGFNSICRVRAGLCPTPFNNSRPVYGLSYTNPDRGLETKTPISKSKNVDLSSVRLPECSLWPLPSYTNLSAPHHSPLPALSIRTRAAPYTPIGVPEYAQLVRGPPGNRRAPLNDQPTHGPYQHRHLASAEGVPLASWGAAAALRRR